PAIDLAVFVLVGLERHEPGAVHGGPGVVGTIVVGVVGQPREPARGGVIGGRDPPLRVGRGGGSATPDRKQGEQGEARYGHSLDQKLMSLGIQDTAPPSALHPWQGTGVVCGEAAIMRSPAQLCQIGLSDVLLLTTAQRYEPATF